MKTFTVSEVSDHNDGEQSVWLIIHDKVYDVTNFLDEHPGGREILENNAGKNASQCFDDIGHSDEAKSLMKMYRIGVISSHSDDKDILQEQNGNGTTEELENVEQTEKYKTAESEQQSQTFKPKSLNEPPTGSSVYKWIWPLVLMVAGKLLYDYCKK